MSTVEAGTRVTTSAVAVLADGRATAEFADRVDPLHEGLAHRSGR
jgi:hypothetical protein